MIMKTNYTKMIKDFLKLIFLENKQLNIKTLDEVILFKDVLANVYSDLVANGVNNVLMEYETYDYILDNYVLGVTDKFLNINNFYDSLYMRFQQWLKYPASKRLNTTAVYWNLYNLCDMIAKRSIE